MKEKMQSKKQKQAYSHPIKEMLQVEKPVTKAELMEKFEVDERTIREWIAECSMFYAVIATSNRAGYRLARKIDDLKTEEEILGEKELVEHRLNDLKSRVTALKKKMKPLIAYLKVLEKKESLLNLEKSEEQNV